MDWTEILMVTKSNIEHLANEYADLFEENQNPIIREVEGAHITVLGNLHKGLISSPQETKVGQPWSFKSAQMWTMDI